MDELCGRSKGYILLETVVGYLADDPFYYRIRPDKVNGVQPPDVYAENAPHNGILPLRRRDYYVLDEHSGPPVPLTNPKNLSCRGP